LNGIKIVCDTTGRTVPMDQTLLTCDSISGCTLIFKEFFTKFETKQFTVTLIQSNSSELEAHSLEKYKPHTFIFNPEKKITVVAEDRILKIIEITNHTEDISLGIQVIFLNEDSVVGGPSGMYAISNVVFPPVELVIKKVSSRQTKQGLTISVEYETLEDCNNIHLHFIYDVTGGKRRFSSFVSIEKPSVVTGHSFSARYSRLDIKNEGKVLISINGLDNIERRLKPEECYAKNILPVTKLISIQDQKSKKGIAILVDRSEGGYSPHEGVIELTLVRTSRRKDSGGGWGFLMEPKNLTIEHQIFPFEQSPIEAREIQVEQDSPLLYGRLRSNLTNGKPGPTSRNNITKSPFLRSLIAFKPDGILLRFYNLHETEDITIPDVRDWAIKYYGIEGKFDIMERTLDYNYPIEYLTQHEYSWRNSTSVREEHAKTSLDGGKGVILKPLRTRTYRLVLEGSA